MSNRVTEELINGVRVTRYNGNNCGRGGSRGVAANPAVRAAWITKDQKKKAKARKKASKDELRMFDG